jgi:hypothetical protein
MHKKNNTDSKQKSFKTKNRLKKDSFISGEYLYPIFLIPLKQNMNEDCSQNVCRSHVCFTQVL